MGTRAGQLWTTRFPQIRMRRYPIGPGMILIWVLGAFGMGVTVWRWIVGLGPTTNLSDGRGWGLWISFDMMAGIALAAGAFSVAAVVYIFNLKRFYPIARPAILTGFISYILAGLTLLVDLGQPQRIWHLIIYWNIHSPLFEIGWCVMLYLTVLALEFSPVVFEWLGWKVPLKIIHAIQIPLIIAGITLSTMHQSTLGTMLTILPERIHPLWYSPLLPVFFFVSAIAGGMGMAIFESFHSARTYGYPFELGVLSRLAKAIPWVLGIYFAIRMGDVVIGNKLQYLLQGGAPATMFLIEMVGGVLLPLVMFADPRVRHNANGITWAAFFTLGGVMINRINSALGFFNGAFYLPSWSELAVTIGLTCLGIIMYDAAVRFLPMFPEPTLKAEKEL